MRPLAEAVGARMHFYSPFWEGLQNRSWTAGHCMRRFGEWYAGSSWNAIAPAIGEKCFLKSLGEPGKKIAHFLWSEFASPRHAASFRSRQAVTIGTYHASARKLGSVVRRKRHPLVFDWVTLMSETQKEFFLDAGVPEDRLRVILHGVDTTYFCPDEKLPPLEDGPIKGLIVGYTERDHSFLAGLMRKIPPGVLHLKIAGSQEQLAVYEGCPCVEVLSRLTDEDLRNVYRSSDLLVMPMLDCTANNAVLEAMACGTPVITNRVGGIPEYVSESSSYIMDGKKEDEWIDCLKEISRNKSELRVKRVPVRKWVETFDWHEVATLYLGLYKEAMQGL